MIIENHPKKHKIPHHHHNNNIVVINQKGCLFFIRFLASNQWCIGDVFDTGFTETFHAIGFVFGIISRKEEPSRISFAGQYMRRDSIQEISIMRNDPEKINGTK
jgi:hypothetical protein